MGTFEETSPASGHSGGAAPPVEFDSDERFRLFYESVPVTMLHVDDSGAILDVSDRFVAWSGYTRADVVGTPLGELAPPGAAGRLTGEALQKTAAALGIAKEIDGTICLRDGTEREVVLSVVSERRAEGATARFWIVLRDVTERNRVYEELTERQALFEAVFNGAFQLVAVLEPTGAIYEANATLRDFAGLSDTQISGKLIWDIDGLNASADVRARLKVAVEEAASGSFVRDEIEVSGIAEIPVVLDISAKPVRIESDDVDYVILECRDVSEQRRQHAQLLQAAKMEAIGKLTSGIAHDFNNLLTIIGGNLELLDSRLGDDPEPRKRLHRAIDAVFRGQSLTQQLLAFSRRQTLNPVPVDVPTLLASIDDMLDTIGHHIEIGVELADNLMPLLADPYQLETVLLNIVINGRDAMPEGGRITIIADMSEIGPDYVGEVTDLQPGRYVRLSITDTGEGIPPHVLEHIFEPFYTTKPTGRGTGLGMSMAYGFAKQSNGDLKVYSEIGVGTTVRLYLPYTEERPRPKEDRPDRMLADKPQGEMHILVVEDDDEVRELVIELLSDHGYAVEATSNGKDAIELLQQGRIFNLIVSDVVMPGEADGVAVARAARAIDPEQAILFCSGFPRRTLGEAEFRDHRVYFLGKPYRIEELANTVNNIVGK